MANTGLHGVVVPVITPVDSNDNVDEGAFRKILSRLVAAGVQGVFTGGSAGEGPLLTNEQWRRMVEIAFDEVGKKIFLLGGTIDMSTRRVCDKVRVLKSIGYRHFVVTPSFYITCRSASEHLRLYGAARDAGGDMEMIAYNIPSCTGSTLAVDTICEMARHGWIKACKESSGDWAYIQDLLARAKELGLTMMAGDEITAGDALLAGAKGVVNVCANYDPWTYLALVKAGTSGDRAGVKAQMAKVSALRDLLPLSGPCWISGIKYALSALGMGNGMPVSPLEPATPEQKAMIDKAVRTNPPGPTH